MTADELQHIFSSNIKRYRQLNNMTQMKLSETADLSVGYLCDLERGNKWGTPETITKLASALHINPYQLFLDSASSDKASTIQKDLFELSGKLKKSVDGAISDILKKYIE